MTIYLIAAGAGLLALSIAIRLAHRRKRRCRPMRFERYRQPNPRYDRFR